jgi:hypothetical protein
MSWARISTAERFAEMFAESAKATAEESGNMQKERKTAEDCRKHRAEAGGLESAGRRELWKIAEARENLQNSMRI